MSICNANARAMGSLAHDGVVQSRHDKRVEIGMNFHDRAFSLKPDRGPRGRDRGVPRWSFFRWDKAGAPADARVYPPQLRCASGFAFPFFVSFHMSDVPRLRSGGPAFRMDLNLSIAMRSPEFVGARLFSPVMGHQATHEEPPPWKNDARAMEIFGKFLAPFCTPPGAKFGHRRHPTSRSLEVCWLKRC